MAISNRSWNELRRNLGLAADEEDLSHLDDEQRAEILRIRKEDKERRQRAQFRKCEDPRPEDNKPSWAQKPQEQVPTWSTQKHKDERRYGERLERPRWAKDPAPTSE